MKYKFKELSKWYNTNKKEILQHASYPECLSIYDQALRQFTFTSEDLRDLRGDIYNNI